MRVSSDPMEKEVIIYLISALFLFNVLLWNVNSILTDPFSTKILYAQFVLGNLAIFILFDGFYFKKINKREQ